MVLWQIPLALQVCIYHIFSHHMICDRWYMLYDMYICAYTCRYMCIDISGTSIYIYMIYRYICPADARQNTPARCCIVLVFAKKKTVTLSASMVVWHIHPHPPSSMLNMGMHSHPFGWLFFSQKEPLAVNITNIEMRGAGFGLSTPNLLVMTVFFANTGLKATAFIDQIQILSLRRVDVKSWLAYRGAMWRLLAVPRQVLAELFGGLAVSLRKLDLIFIVLTFS